MANKLELLRVPAFAELPEDQIDWFLSQAQEINIKPGEVFIEQGSPADSMFVLLDGQLHMRGDLGGQSVVFTFDAGDVGGRLPFSRMRQFTFSGRAAVESRVLRFPADRFPELVQKMPELAGRLVGLMSDRIREVTRIEQQQERLASLGKLSAGLAHELNNPASAAKRAASQLRDTLQRIKESSQQLGARELSPQQRANIEQLEASLTQRSGRPRLSGLAVSSLEEEIDVLLRSHGYADLWQLSADLAQRGADPQSLEILFSSMDPDTARAALIRIAALLEVSSLLDQIESSTSRISDLVRAIKEYTYMDQSPIQNVDVVKSLENTLTILNHKLKHGVTVERDYGTVPLLVNSFGSDLNQVWTNVIDNAIDAMKGKGTLHLRTYVEGNLVVVEIADNGPGIPEEIQPRIFEPFFTTKKVGEGTGLGLDTVQRIIKKHNGSIQFDSKPGETRFEIWIPLAQPAVDTVASSSTH
jgi:signal transduction histidine kinase